MSSENLLITSSAQQAGIELSIAPLPIPGNGNITRVRSASNNGRRLVFESPFNYTGGNPDGNNEIWVKEADSPSIIQITNTADYTDPTGVNIDVDNFTPVISGNGNRIVFASNAPSLDPANTNGNGNYEIYIADLPIGATIATITRITNTGRERGTEDLRERFTTFAPTINDDGDRIAFVAIRQTFNAINGFLPFTANNPDLNDDIFVADLTSGARQYSQVTFSSEDQRPPSFNIGGFNTNPKLSGNGEMLAFISDYNYDNNRNPEFDAEFYLYRLSDRTFRQITVSQSSLPNGSDAVIPALDPNTGNYGLDTFAPMHTLSSYSKPISGDGMRFVFESAGNFDGSNPNKGRQLWLYDFPSNTIRRITNQTVPASLTQNDLRRIDHTFTPSINSAGTFVTFNSSLNFTSQNPDASKEIFRYEINNGSFRQLTFTAPTTVFSDQRFNTTSSFLSDNGDVVSFNYPAQALVPNTPNVIGLFQMIIRPITRSSPGAQIFNSASLVQTQVARGSLSTVLGNELANSTPSFSAGAPFLVDGVSASVGGIAARLTFVSPGEVNIVIPNEIATGDAVPFLVNNNGVRSTGTIRIVNASPGIFTADGSGTGMPSAMCLSKYQGLPDIFSDPPCAASGNSFVSILVLFGTGWRNAPGTQVRINGMTLTPLYSGVEGFGPLKDQINLVVPSNLVGLTDADLSVVTAGTNIESNKVKVSFQDISTMLTILEGNAGVECLSKPPGMGDVFTDPPCTVSNGATTGLLVLYGTGWRSVPNPQVKFEEVTLNPIYSGPSSINPVIDQMNILLPSTLAGRTGQVSVIIPGAAVESNKVPISFLPLP